MDYRRRHWPLFGRVSRLTRRFRRRIYTHRDRPERLALPTIALSRLAARWPETLLRRFCARRGCCKGIRFRVPWYLRDISFFFFFYFEGEIFFFRWMGKFSKGSKGNKFLKLDRVRNFVTRVVCFATDISKECKFLRSWHFSQEENFNCNWIFFHLIFSFGEGIDKKGWNFLNISFYFFAAWLWIRFYKDTQKVFFF